MFDDHFMRGFVKTSAVPIQDLSWLAVDEDEYRANERLPDNEKALNVKDQLRVLWDHHVHRGPGAFNLVPNLEKPPVGIEILKEGSEDLDDLEKKVKIAMMNGVTGEALVELIRTKFARDTIEASKEILEKLAFEQGVLGFAYIDPNLLDCQKATKFGNSFKLPEFVKKRTKCADCTFISKDICLKFELPVVEEIQFSSSLVAKLKKKLDVRGFKYEDDSTLEPKQRLQLIFLSRYLSEAKHSNHYTAPRKEKILVSDAEIKQFLAEGSLKAEEHTEQIALEKISKAKFQVLSFLRRSLIAGQHIENIIPTLRHKYTQGTLRLAREEIKELVKAHGFFGNLYVTLDTFHKCADLSEHLKKTHSLAQYLKKSSKCFSCTSNQESKCLELGLTLVENPEDIKVDKILFTSYLTELANRGKISYEAAKELLDPEDWEESLKKLLKSKSLQQPLRGGYVAEEHIVGQESSGLEKFQKDQKHQSVLLANTFFALEKGVSLKAIRDKLSTLVPLNIGSYLLERALKEATVIDTESFKYCRKIGGEGFVLNKTAQLLSKDACTDCIFNSKVHCTKIGSKFKDSTFKIKKETTSDTTAQEYKEFYEGSKITIKMAEKHLPLEGEIEGLNEFTIG